MPLVRRVYNRIGNIVTYIFTGVNISDSQTGFRAYSRKFAEIISMVDVSGYGYDSEVLRITRPYNPKIVEVPITVIYDDYSMGKKTHGMNLLGGIKIVGVMVMRSLLGK